MHARGLRQLTVPLELPKAGLRALRIDQIEKLLLAGGHGWRPCREPRTDAAQDDDRKKRGGFCKFHQTINPTAPGECFWRIDLSPAYAGHLCDRFRNSRA